MGTYQDVLSRDDVPTTFDPDLYQALTAALSVGDVVSTLSTGLRIAHTVKPRPSTQNLRSDRWVRASRWIPLHP